MLGKITWYIFFSNFLPNPMHIKKGNIYLVLDSIPISDENILGRSDSRTKSLGRGVSFLIAPVVPLKSY